MENVSCVKELDCLVQQRNTVLSNPIDATLISVFSTGCAARQVFGTVFRVGQARRACFAGDGFPTKE